MMNQTTAPKNIGLFSIFPSIMFILDAYSLTDGGSSICNLLVLMMMFYLLVVKRIAAYKPLLYLLCVDVLINTVSLMFTASMRTNFSLSYKIAIVYLLYLLVYAQIWTQLTFSEESFYKAAETVGVICAVFAFMQFVFASAGISFYDGRLPLPLAEGSHFGGLFDANTGDLRVHSFFEEPSYLAFYEIPVTIHLLQRRKYLRASICGGACLISGSMIGILGLAIAVFVMVLFDNDIKIKSKLTSAIVIVCLVLVIIVLYSSNDSVKKLFDYYIDRINNVDKSSKRADSSFSLRIYGFSNLFKRYNSFNKMVGVGFNQYRPYFGLYVDYSNDIVSTLLNFGYVGIVALILTLISMARKLTGHGKVYFVIFCILLAVDHSWFGAMFFYILTWVILKSKEKQKGMFFGIIR